MMKKNKLLILLVAICIGLFVPKDVFAFKVYNNINVDYRFFVDEDNAGDLKFRLYDKSGTLNFESNYYAESKQYIIGVLDCNFVKRFATGEYGYSGYYWDILDTANYETSFREYIPYHEGLHNLKLSFDSDDVSDFLSSNKLNGSVWKYDYSWNYYTYIPMILEETKSGMKKIVFASITVRNQHYYNQFISSSFTQLNLMNNTYLFVDETTMLNDSYLENVDFMRKTTLDYSDELWEELNNGPIASSEIMRDTINSSTYRYKNKSISGNQYNLPEETLNDYAQSLPVLTFKKNDIDNNTNIVNVITNPKTFNNGVGILIISLLLIIGLSVFLIKKNKKKLRINS